MQGCRWMAVPQSVLLLLSLFQTGSKWLSGQQAAHTCHRLPPTHAHTVAQASQCSPVPANRTTHEMKLRIRRMRVMMSSLRAMVVIDGAGGRHSYEWRDGGQGDG